MSMLSAIVISLAVALSIMVTVNMYFVNHAVEEKGGATLFMVFTVGLYITVIDAVIILIQ